MSVVRVAPSRDICQARGYIMSFVSPLLSPASSNHLDHQTFGTKCQCTSFTREGNGMINICQSSVSDEQRTWSSDASRWARQEVNAFDTR
jgi:hypothetical protein